MNGNKICVYSLKTIYRYRDPLEHDPFCMHISIAVNNVEFFVKFSLLHIS